MQTESRGKNHTVGFVRPSIPGKWMLISAENSRRLVDRQTGQNWDNITGTARVALSLQNALPQTEYLTPNELRSGLHWHEFTNSRSYDSSPVILGG